MRSVLIILFLLNIFGCKKESVFDRELKSVPRELYIAQVSDGYAPHEFIKRQIISSALREHYQYDSLYITFVPPRIDIDSGYTVTEPPQVMMVYHFFSPKDTYNQIYWVGYDPVGDSTFKYISSRWN